MALIAWFIPLSSIPSINPLFEDRLPVTSPINFSGVTTSTFIIGSNITGRACLQASWTAIEAAILKAISLESTS